MQILHFVPEDILELKKEHPCGNRMFRVLRIGSDVRMVCIRCGRDLTLERIKLEKSIKKIHSHEENHDESRHSEI